jgi:hypothetical protein
MDKFVVQEVKNKHMHILELLNLLFSGILAGLEIAAHYGFRGPALALEEKPQIVFRQQTVRRLRWLVPLFFLPATITAIALSIINENITGLILRIIALAAAGIWICLRVAGTVKINAASLDWNPDTPPKDWRSQIDKVERFHIVGTWLMIIAFVCSLLATG